MNIKIRDDTAADYLTSVGIRVLDRDWEGTDGILPIVANDSRDKLCLVAVVVLNGPVRAPYLAQTRINRLRRLAVAWMSAHGVRYDRVRVDVVGVQLLAMGQSNVEHVRNVDSLPS